jgi:hypothetical protein
MATVELTQWPLHPPCLQAKTLGLTLGCFHATAPRADPVISTFFFFFFLCRVLHLEPLHQPFFVMGIFKIESCELFAWAGSNHDPPDLC